MEIFLQFSGGKRMYPTWATKNLGKFSEELKLWAALKTCPGTLFHVEIQSHSSLEMTGHPLLATASYLKLNTQTQPHILCRVGCIKPSETLNSHLKMHAVPQKSQIIVGTLPNPVQGATLFCLHTALNSFSLQSRSCWW